MKENTQIIKALTALRELRRQAGYEPNAWYEEKEESFLTGIIAQVEKEARECPRHHEGLRCRGCLAELQEIGEIQHGVLCGCMDAEDILHFTCSHNWCKTCPEPKADELHQTGGTK